MHRSIDNKFSVLAFDRDNGEIQLTLLLDGVYNANKDNAKLLVVGSDIYFAGQRSDYGSSYARHFHLAKIVPYTLTNIGS